MCGGGGGLSALIMRFNRILSEQLDAEMQPDGQNEINIEHQQ